MARKCQRTTSVICHSITWSARARSDGGTVRPSALAVRLRFYRNARFRAQLPDPVLILPDDIPPHPYAVAMEAAILAPNSEVSILPWKDPKERIPLAVRQIRSFLRWHDGRGVTGP